MNILVDKKSIIPVYKQIAAEIRNTILNGELQYGSVLPSERALAKLIDVHRNTVTKAYQELKSLGMVEARQGIGYIVIIGYGKPMAVPKVASLKDKSVHRNANRAKPVNWLTEIKPEYIDHEKSFDDIFQKYRNEKKISLSTGVSMPTVYKRDELALDISKVVAYGGTNQYFYSPYKGDEGLRQQIVSFLSTKNIRASASEIQIVTETNQAIDFIINLLINPGDKVVVTEPVHPDTYRALELAGAEMVTVPADEEGMVVDAVERIAMSTEIKLIIADSSFHDPTGTCMPEERRRKLLEISGRYRIPIVEEDAASELYYEGDPVKSIKSMDTLGNVIYIYSFSLTFAPGLNLAFIVADREVIRNLSYLVSVRLVAIDWLAQKLMAGYLEDGTYHSKIRIFREKYKEKRDVLIRELGSMDENVRLKFEKPRGGVYIWARLPEGADSRDLVHECYRAGLSIIPGYIFYPNKDGGRNMIRLNYSYEKLEDIPKGVRILERVLLRQLKGSEQ